MTSPSLKLERVFEGNYDWPISVWQLINEKYAWDCLRPTFKSGSSVMIRDTLIGFDKSPLVIITKDKRTTKNLIELVYHKVLYPFYNLHNHL